MGGKRASEPTDGLPGAWRLVGSTLEHASTGDAVDLLELRDCPAVVRLLAEAAGAYEDHELGGLARELLHLLDPVASMVAAPRRLRPEELAALVATAPTRETRRERRAGGYLSSAPMLLRLAETRVARAVEEARTAAHKQRPGPPPKVAAPSPPGEARGRVLGAAAAALKSR